MRIRLAVFCLICAIAMPETGAGQDSPPVKPDHLKQLSITLNALGDVVDQAWGYDCPDLDPKQARQIVRALSDVQALIERYKAETAQGRYIARKGYREVTNGLALREHELARMQRVFAWQDFFTNLGKLMLDMIDITSFGNDILENVLSESSKFSPDGKIEAVAKILFRANDAHQALVAAREQGKALFRGAPDSESPQNSDVVQQAVQDYLGFAKSAYEYAVANKAWEASTRVLKSARQEMEASKAIVDLAQLQRLDEQVIKLGREARLLKDKAAQLKRGARGDVAQVLLGVAQKYAESLRAEMAERVREQEQIVPAEQRVVSGTFRNWQSWAAADEAVAQTLDRLRSTRAALDKVFKGHFGPASYPVKPEPTFTTSGEALVYLNTVLPQRVTALASAATGFRIGRPLEPRLQLEKNAVAPEGDLVVRFSAPPCLPRDAWVGIVPSDTPHTSEDANDKRRLSPHHYLDKRKEGTVTFKAPTEPGSYDVRMNDTDQNGKELVSVTFTVITSLTGKWRLSSGGQEKRGYSIKEGNQDEASVIYSQEKVWLLFTGKGPHLTCFLPAAGNDELRFGLRLIQLRMLSSNELEFWTKEGPNQGFVNTGYRLVRDDR